jgi:hypothetical protein
MWGWGRTGGTACLHRSDELHSFSEQGSLLNSYHSPSHSDITVRIYYWYLLSMTAESTDQGPWWYSALGDPERSQISVQWLQALRLPVV